jgi:hypothetical protein
MSRFVLTAQLQLQAPTNTAQVVRQIQSQLNNVQVNVQVQGTAQATRQVQQVAQSLNAANSAASNLGRTFAISVKRFTALAVATRAVSLFTNTLASATEEAISFERQLIKISQVTGQSIGELKGLTKTITQLSTGLGVGSQSLLEVSTILLQAGLNSRDTEVALKSLAKAALAPNFDSISETAEGAIAVLAQFKEGVGALENQLSSIDAVAGAFAVEAGDLIDVIRRTGGVFKASGGSLNELLALFTSVRATTRESAESISTGLRTIFTRIQRPKTIEFLKQFGVELVDLEGKFVGPFEAIKRLSESLAGLGERDLTFISVAEELGGFRQIGKVLPLLQQFSTAQAALNVAQKANNGLTKNAETAQLALAIRITKVKEEFLALVRGITETSAFQFFANTTLNLASALIRLADALKPVIPLLTAVATIRAAQGIGSFISGFGGGLGSRRTFNKGGKVHHFARGGMVPGTGNRDTVPAMLQPGEFVIRKSSVGKLGAGNLAAMNENRYQLGGPMTTAQKIAAARANKNAKGEAVPIPSNPNKTKTKTFASGSGKSNAVQFSVDAGSIGAFFMNPDGVPDKPVAFKDTPFTLKNPKLKSLAGISGKKLGFGETEVNALLKKGTVSAFFPSIKDVSQGSFGDIVQRTVKQKLSEAVIDSATIMESQLGSPLNANKSALKSTASQRIQQDLGAIRTTSGYLFEGIIDALSGAKPASNQSTFDFPASSIQGNRKRLSALFGSLGKLGQADAKASFSTEIIGGSKSGSLVNKIINSINNGILGGIKMMPTNPQRKNIGGLIQKFAKGGIAQPLVDDILSNASNAILPTPQSAIQKLIKAGGGFVDIDRTLKRTVGDQAYARARTEKEKQAVLSKYFANSQNRLNDIKTAGLTQFGTELQNSIKSGQLNGSNIRVISKSLNTPGVSEYLSGIFGIPSRNFAFTGGKSKVPLMRRFATGGGVGTDTVPALLTPGEFVVNKKSAQAIGYGSLNRMNKVGRYANGGVVQRFAAGGTASASGNNSGNLFSGVGAQLTLVTASLQALIPPIDENSSGLAKLANNFLSLATTVGGAIFALEAFNIKITKDVIAKGFKSLTTTGKGGLGDIIGGFQRRTGSGGKVTTIRSKGESFTEGFDLAKQRSQRVAQLRDLGKSNPLTPNSPYQINRKALRSDLGPNLSKGGKSLTSNFGRLLGQKAASGGITGRLAGFAGGAISRVGGLGGLGGGAVGGAAAGAAALAGPALAITGVVAAINSVIGNFRDLDNQLQDAIKAEKISTAEQLAVAKKASEFPVIGNIVGTLFGQAGDEFLIGISNFFGGESAAQVKAAVATQIQANKAQKALAKATEDSAKAMQDFENGTASALDVLKATTGATAEAVKLAQTTDKQIAANEANKSTGGLNAFNRGLGSILTLGYVQTQEQRNSEIDRQNKGLSEQSKKAEEDALKAAAPGLQVLQRQVAATGGSFNDFLDIIRATDPNLFNIIIKQGTTDLSKSFTNLAKEAERTRKAFDAMSLGFQKVSAVSGALGVGLENYLAKQEAGNIGLESTIRTLEASVTSAAQGISDTDFKAALGDASNGLRKLGASDTQVKKFEENLTAINTAQKFYAQASEEVKNRLVEQFKRGAGADLSAVGKRESFATVIADQLKGAGIGEETRKRISDAIKGADISDTDLNKILAGDLSALDKVLEDLGKTTLNQVIGPLQELAKYNKVLADITKKRLELENNLISAQRGVLEAQLEAQEIMSKYGGPALTPAMRSANAIQQANVQAQGLGVGNLNAGTGAELNARSGQTRARLAQIGGIRVAAAAGNAAAQSQLEGESGTKLAAEEKRLLDLAKSDYETTKELIKNKEAELQLIKEKNSLEKSSVDALVSGDITKFFEQQAAVGAQAAIALGSDRLQGAFGASALGAAAQETRRQQEAGVQELYGQRLSGPGGLTERAFGSAIGAMGVTDGRLAQVAAGTTAEETALQAQIVDLASTLPNFAQAQLESSGMEVMAAQQQYQAAQMQLEAAKQNVNDRAGGAEVQNRARGGLIYANRGIFVPRGTDTVPAMLTPGEFVVRREAVQRGNNLQLLQAMNRGNSNGDSSINGSVGMANGGMVRYRSNGSSGPESGGGGFGISPEVINNLVTSLTQFNKDLSSNIEKLNSTNFNVKLDNTNINVNLTGTSFLGKLKEDLQSELYNFVGKEIQNYGVAEGGRLKRNTGTINT